MSLLNMSEKIYKYCSINDFFLNVEENTIVLSRPSLFNDPFDSNISIPNNIINKTLELIDYFGIILKIKNSINDLPNDLIKFVQLENYGIDSSGLFEPSVKLRNLCKYIKSTNPIVFDCENEKFKEKTLKELIEVKNHILVSCFSKNPSSILMWSHYANSHKGVCIEYVSVEEKIYDVNYKENIEFFDIYSLASIISGNILKERQNNFDESWLEENYGMPFITKSLDWYYEAEVRCLLNEDTIKSFCNNLVDNNGNCVEGKYIYKMHSKINKVIIGCKVSQDDEERIRKKCEQLNIEVTRAKLNDSKYKLDI